MQSHKAKKARRQYNSLVATETLEDYALRYSPSSFRKWSPFLLANTAIGSISFLALEVIGAVLLINYGFTNAFWAIAFASIIIFAAGVPITYYTARYNIDIDLLTRSAGFGYVGSTVTSLIYASFCFIFFALEAAIMAQAIKLYFGLPLFLGYILCSVIIIPIVYYGITLINRLHLWTQPFWVALMLIPFYFVLTREPQALEFLTNFQGHLSGNNEFDWYYFGIAAGISFSLIGQIGEQVDYLRFMPDMHKKNRVSWWVCMLFAGPGWIILGFLKQIGGALLAAVAVLTGLAIADAKEPVHMYHIGYTYVIENPQTALAISTIFVIISQIKINVTNAYAGSLAWSNFFSRAAHSHPGRVVWLVFNTAIALLIMELGVFDGLQNVLGLYSNAAIAWIAAVVADLAINKPFKLSPPIIEFKRAHLYNINPVGFLSMTIASLLSIIAFTGILGKYTQAYSWMIALVTSFIMVPLLAILTKGRYYIARPNEHFHTSEKLITCAICDQQYAQTDFAYCSFYDAPICSLCCTLDSTCKDQCKPNVPSYVQHTLFKLIRSLFQQRITAKSTRRLIRFALLLGTSLGIIGLVFWLTFTTIDESLHPLIDSHLRHLFFQLFWLLALLISIAVWWTVLISESRDLAEKELTEQNELLSNEITERKALQETIQNMAFHDYLTQLPNRRYFMDRLQQAIGMAQRMDNQLALLMLDLDHFKAVNDQFGHLAGDELLQQVAKRISKRLRNIDMVARLGGDEFVVLLENITHEENAAFVAKDLVVELNKPYQLAQGNEAQIGVSIGISLFPHHGNTPETLMNYADTALYKAKKTGRGCFSYFSEEMTLEIRERFSLEMRLRKALDQQ